MTTVFRVEDGNTDLTLSAGVEADRDDTRSPEDDDQLTEAEARFAWGDR